MYINTNTWVWVRIVLFLLVCQHIVTSRTLTVAQVVSLVFVIHLITCAHEVSDSLRLCSHLLSHAPPVALLPLLLALEARRLLAAHSAQREYGLVWRVLPPHRLWAQRLRLQGDFGRALHRAPGLAAVLLRQGVSRGRGARWRCTRGYASRSSPST